MEWKPIETAPKDGTEVLVYARRSYAVASWDGEEWRDIGDIGWAGMCGDDNQPTHWMQLPAPPIAEYSEAVSKARSSIASMKGGA